MDKQHTNRKRWQVTDRERDVLRAFVNGNSIKPVSMREVARIVGKVCKLAGVQISK